MREITKLLVAPTHFSTIGRGYSTGGKRVWPGGNPISLKNGWQSLNSLCGAGKDGQF
jgi:hypothetical protein